MITTSYTFFLKSGRTIECDSYTENMKTYWLVDAETGGREFDQVEVSRKDVECIATSHYNWDSIDVPF